MIKNFFKHFIHKIEDVQERLWEIFNYYFHALPSDAAMTARLRRMRVSSFYAYVWKQMKGDYGRRNFLPWDKNYIKDQLLSGFKEASDTIINAADKIIDGKFNFLGCDWVDLKRGEKAKGWEINWNKDPITGEIYKQIFSQYRWDVFKMRPKNADVKGPWELSRCQHFPTLGQAYWLSGENKYVECYANTISDFIKNNPVGFGVHWACPMDVGLRVVGWLSGLSFFQGAQALNYAWWKIFLKSLVEHGNFIASNLEYGTYLGKIIVSNHGLANLLGLYWLALNFPALDAACVWRGIAETGLEQQIQIQILPDGGGFESSIPYHRLVVEMFLSAYALSVSAGFPLSEAYRARVLKALFFLHKTRQDQGRQPQIGDADDGRAHIFINYGNDKALENMDHLLAAGAKVLNCKALIENISKNSNLEALFWDVSIKESMNLPTSSAVTLFPHFGAAVIRQNSHYLLFNNGKVGTLGIGNHKHNDQLAIEWAIGAQPLLVDGGSFTYTQDPKARNYFRSTASHNTVMINQTEQHDLNPEWLFRLEQNGTMGFHPIQVHEQGIFISGWYTSTKNNKEFTHTRNICISKDEIILLEDEFKGAPQTHYQWYFLIHPTVQPRIEHNKVILQGINTGVLESSDLNWELIDAWYSPGYGRRIKTKAIIAHKEKIDSKIKIMLYGENIQYSEALNNLKDLNKTISMSEV